MLGHLEVVQANTTQLDLVGNKRNIWAAFPVRRKLQICGSSNKQRDGNKETETTGVSFFFTLFLKKK